MKKILLSFFLFCILGVSHSFASFDFSQTSKYTTNCTAITDGYSCGPYQSINFTDSTIFSPSDTLEISFTANFANFAYSFFWLKSNGSYPYSYLSLDTRLYGSNYGFRNHMWDSVNSLMLDTGGYSTYSILWDEYDYRFVFSGSTHQIYIDDVLVNTFTSSLDINTLLTDIQNRGISQAYMQNQGNGYGDYIIKNLQITSGPQLECETYTETQTISSPGFTINSYLTGSDTTSLFEAYDASYTEIYDEMIVNYFDFQTLSTESFSTTGATFLGTTFPLKYPTLSFSAYNSDDADYTIHDGFIFTGGVLNNPPNISENSFEYVKIRDGNDKEIYLDEIIQGKKYLIPGGVKDVEFKFKRSWYQIFDTHIIFDFQFINFAEIDVEKTFCKNLATGENYIDGELTEYIDIDDIPKVTSEVEIVQGDIPTEPSVDSWTGTTSTISLDTFGASYESDPKCSVENTKYKWDSFGQLALIDKVFLPAFNTLIVPLKCYFLTFANIFDYKSGFDFSLPFVGTLEKGNPLGEAVGIAFVFLATISFFKLLPNSKN